jgi:hypothetical protein
MFKWETEKEKTLRLAKISPKKKMEWLREMNEFMVKASSKKVLKIRQRLRELGAR